MNEKRKYELIIVTIFLIGAIFCGILDIFSLVIYLLIGILIFTLYILQKKKAVEQMNRYISKLTNRIKDSSEKGINKFPIGIIVIDEDKNIEWANNFIYKNKIIKELLKKKHIKIFKDLEYIS